MKRIEYCEYGGPEAMRLAEFELPAPGPDEVAVHVHSAAVNPIDWKLRNGAMKIVTGRKFPRAMGMDLSGTVTAVGSAVTRFRPGDQVFGLARFKETGAFATDAITKEAFLAKKPESVSFEEAACLGSPGVTAWNGVVDKAGVRPGQSVFINGCGGSVGQSAVQIARMFGATVSGSCSASAMDQVRPLGLKKLYDYRTTDLTALDERFDIVYDTSGTMDMAAGLGMIKPRGVYVDLEPAPGKFIRAIFNRRLKIVVCTARPDILDRLAQAAAKGEYRLPIGKIVGLNDAITLITDLEKGAKLGGRGVVTMG